MTEHKLEGISTKNSSSEISRWIQKQLKVEFPECKFSVRCSHFSGSSSIDVYLMTAPFQVFSKETQSNGYPVNGHAQLNHYNFRRYEYEDGLCNGAYLTKQGWDLLKRADEIQNYANWDKSDIQSDYFNVHYYTMLSIGKWDKPFQVINRKECLLS